MFMATTKQQKAVAKISENIRKDKPEPIGKILKDVGYSDSISESPTFVTRSQGFIELLEKAGVTDDKLAKVLDEGLTASKTVVMGKDSGDSFVDIQPDHVTRHKYLETGLRLKGYGGKDDKGNSTNNYVQIINQTKDRYV